MKVTRLALLMLMLTVSTAAANLGGGSFGSSTGGQESIGGSNTTTCEWYWIDCGGALDWCCGSYSSCESYCNEMCGPCEYIPPNS